MAAVIQRAPAGCGDTPMGDRSIFASTELGTGRGTFDDIGRLSIDAGGSVDD
jgi:hypothetical protein